jgi:hypothetical protein
MQVLLDSKDSRVSLVQLDLLEQLVQQDNVVTLDHQDFKGLLETLEPRDNKDSKDNSVPREQLDNRAFKVLLEQLAQMA